MNPKAWKHSPKRCQGNTQRAGQGFSGVLPDASRQASPLLPAPTQASLRASHVLPSFIITIIFIPLANFSSSLSMFLTLFSVAFALALKE